jgi:uncharacterized protein (TIGR02391 family)
MARGVPSIPDTALRAICGVLAETNSGLSGSEIGQLLKDTRIADSDPSQTKRIRLFDALAARQQRDACANNVIAFIQNAMDPIRYISSSGIFEARRTELNVALALVGYKLGEDGKIAITDAAKTLAEAEGRARSLEKKLRQRRVHPDVLRFCKAELLQDNYFHAVLEASKSVTDKIRNKTSLTTDGDALVTKAFSGERPLLAINSLETESHRSEQNGLANLLRGMFGTFRNPTSHAPRITW